MASSTSLAAVRFPDSQPPVPVIFGRGAAMAAIRCKLDKVANAQVPVLIQGESGTGKEVIAAYLHSQSRWRAGSLVKVNCPAIPASLLEPERFPSAGGSGGAAWAGTGTLLLDEIGELDPGLQSKLLHLLQDRDALRLGGEPGLQVRIVCATHCDLLQEVAAGNFRRDLYYRINVLALCLPPLRERREDIPALVAHFLDLYNRQYGCHARPFSAPLARMLANHEWPGNIRELENLVQRYVILDSEEVVAAELTAARAQPGDPEGEYPVDGSVPLRELTRRATRQLERKIILRALQASHWNRKRTARALQISYRALLYKIKDAGVPPKRPARSDAAARGSSAANAAAVGADHD